MSAAVLCQYGPPGFLSGIAAAVVYAPAWHWYGGGKRDVE
jgi:hypothetical protein